MNATNNLLALHSDVKILDAEKWYRHTPTMPHVAFHYNGQKKIIEGKEGETLLKIAINNAVPMEHACGGNGFCTTCMCQVKAGMEHLTERNEREENMGITKDPYRLGCQTRLKGTGDVTVNVTE